MMKLSPSHTLGITSAAVLLFIAISIGFVLKVTVDHLLYSDATATAESWAKYVIENVEDIEDIANGAQPSAASMTFFIRAQQTRNVFGFAVADLQGGVQLQSDGSKISTPRGTIRDEAALTAAQLRRPVVDVKEGTPPVRPLHYSQAYLPVIIDGAPRAVVAAYIDLAEKYNEFRNVFLISVVTLCLLTGAGVSIPMIAWRQATKEKQQADRRIRFLAAHDPLTSAINRAELTERLGVALAGLPTEGNALALHFIDLDHFKAVNDSFGHDGGDAVLKVLADRFSSTLREGDLIGRFGGDEFVVVQAHVNSKEQAEAFAERLRTLAVDPIDFKDQQIPVAVSIGVALAPVDGRTPERLLKSADLAVYKSKADGRNCIRFFSLDMDAELSARIKLEKAIRNAVATGGFVLHFQPMFELANHRLIGFEALVRLPSEDGKLISPLVFLPVAEELRLIDKVGAWVLHEACRAATSWPDNLTVAVNLSPEQFTSGAIGEVVANALKEAGLDPHRLEIEITEVLLLQDADAAMNELRKLKAMGVAIVMDDFGTGYSSLSYLWRFPFNKIKIDRSFMLGLDRSGRDAETVVKTIVALGRELKMHVTVEGVETPKQAAFVEGISGDQAQGFYFGRPIPSTEITPDILTKLQRAMDYQGMQQARG